MTNDSAELLVRARAGGGPLVGLGVVGLRYRPYSPEMAQPLVLAPPRIRAGVAATQAAAGLWKTA